MDLPTSPGKPIPSDQLGEKASPVAGAGTDDYLATIDDPEFQAAMARLEDSGMLDWIRNTPNPFCTPKKAKRERARH